MQSFFTVEKIEQRAFFFLAGFCLTISLSMAASNIFLALTCISFLHRMLRKRDDVISFYKNYNTFFKLLLALIITVIVSSLFSENTSQSLKTAADFYIYRIMPLFITWFIVKTKKQLLILLLLILLSITLNNFASIGQVYFARHYHIDAVTRFSGLIPYMTQATILSFATPILAIAAAHYKKYRTILLFAFATSLVTLFFNMTRGAWFAALATFIVLLIIYNKNFKTIAIAMLILFGLSFILYKNVPYFEARVKTITDYSIKESERMKLITSAYNMWKDNPIIGIGFARFKNEYKERYILPEATERNLEHAHNNVMHVLAETGIVGEIAFLTFWGYLFYFSFRNFKETENPYALFLLAVILAVHLHGLSEYTLGASRTIKIVFLALGIGLKGIDLEKKDA